MEQPSRLLQLPREVRDQILQYASAGRILNIGNNALMGTDLPQQRPRIEYDMNLLLVNSQIYEEAKDAAIATYTDNIFHFDSIKVFTKFTDKLPSHDREAIHELHINVTILKSIDWLHRLSGILADYFPGLQKLFIYRSAVSRRPMLSHPMDMPTALGRNCCKMRRVNDVSGGRPSSLFGADSRVPKFRTWVRAHGYTKEEYDSLKNATVLLCWENIAPVTLETLFFGHVRPDSDWYSEVPCSLKTSDNIMFMDLMLMDQLARGSRQHDCS